MRMVNACKLMKNVNDVEIIAKKACFCGDIMGKNKMELLTYWQQRDIMNA